MLIIIEGVDCSGKSTLVDKLVEQLGVDNTTVLHKGPPTHSNAIEEYIWPLSGYFPGSSKHIICDRWHIGEMIYPLIFKRKGIMSPQQFTTIDDVISQLGGFIVYLEPDLDILYKRFAERGDESMTSSTLFKSYVAFCMFMTDMYKRSDPRIVTHTRDITDGLVNFVVTMSAEYERQVVWNASH